MRTLLGIKEGDKLIVEISGNTILLRPKGPSVENTWGIAKLDKVELEEVEEALGRED